MGKKAWLHPRVKKLVKPHIRIGKNKTEVIEPYLHEYPHADKLKVKKERPKKEEQKKLSPSEKKKKENVDKAEQELACKMGV